MVEDIEFNAILKDALEEGGAFEVGGVTRHRAKAIYWASPLLLAASLAIITAFRVHLTTPPDTLSEALSFLSEAYEVELDSAATPAEQLLAWQDAPCADF